MLFICADFFEFAVAIGSEAVFPVIRSNPTGIFSLTDFVNAKLRLIIFSIAQDGALFRY